jgi:hypothetical protein
MGKSIFFYKKAFLKKYSTLRQMPRCSQRRRGHRPRRAYIYIMVLRNHTTRLLLNCSYFVAVWSITLLLTDHQTAVVAFAFLHPIYKTQPRHYLSSIPKRIALLSSADDDSSTQLITTVGGIDGDMDMPNISSLSASAVTTNSSGESVGVGTVGFEKEPLFSLSAVDNMQDAVSGNFPAANVNTSTTNIKSNDDVMLKRWARRLNTFEDAFSIHKLSAVVYTISSFTLMGTAATRWIIGRQELFATVPDYLEPVMWAFCISNFFMCAASIRMAWLYRSNQVASRNAFVGVAGSSLFSAYFLVWASPFAPEQMIAPMASQIGFGILCAWNIVLILDTMIRASYIIDDRRDNRSQEENASYGLEYLRYIASAAWPLPVIVSTGYINAVLFDHGWLISVFDQVLQKEDFGLQASVFYNNVGKIMTVSHLHETILL